MTTDLAAHLADCLRPLPFAQRVVGLARPYDQDEIQEYDGKPVTKRIRTPYPVEFPPGTDSCDRNERYLVPSDETASIWLFEDGGTVEVLVKAGLRQKESTLRLLGWLNPKWFDPAPSESAILDAVLRALGVGQVASFGAYSALGITATVLPADVNLCRLYTYASEAVPLLYPPYRLFGLELKCRYYYRRCPEPLPVILPSPVSC